MSPVRRFLALSSDERRLFVHAVILLPLVRMSLALFGYRRTAMCLAAFVRALPSRLAPAVPASHASNVEFAVAAAARRGFVRASCLPRGLVVWTLLCRDGIDATLKFGVRRRRGRFEAHAWVETRHTRLDTLQSGGFVPLDTPLS